MYEAHIAKIKSKEDAVKFFDYLIETEKALFHPDDDFSVYENKTTHKKSFTPEKADALNARLAEAKSVLGKSVYDVAQERLDKHFNFLKTNALNTKPALMFEDGGQISERTNHGFLDALDEWAFRAGSQEYSGYATYEAAAMAIDRMQQQNKISDKDIIGPYKSKDFATGGQPKTNQMRAKVYITGSPWWVEKLDSTHVWLSNNEESKGTPLHVGQLKKQNSATQNAFYNDVNNWLQGGDTIDGKQYGEFARGGEVNTWHSSWGDRVGVKQLSFKKTDYNVNVSLEKNNWLEVDVNINENGADTVNQIAINDTGANWEQHHWGYMVYPKTKEQLCDVLRALNVRFNEKKLEHALAGGKYEFARGGEVGSGLELFVLWKDKEFADRALKKAGIVPVNISEKEKIGSAFDNDNSGHRYVYTFQNEADRARAFSVIHGLDIQQTLRYLNEFPEGSDELEQLHEARHYQDGGTLKSRFFKGIHPGDRVWYVNKQGQTNYGSVSIAMPTHVVLNTGGPHGRPQVVDEHNYVRHLSAKKEFEPFEPYDPVYEAEPAGALDYVPEEDRWMEDGGEFSNNKKTEMEKFKVHDIVVVKDPKDPINGAQGVVTSLFEQKGEPYAYIKLTKLNESQSFTFNIGDEEVIRVKWLRKLNTEKGNLSRHKSFVITVPKGKETLLSDENEYDFISYISKKLTKKWFGHGPFDVRAVKKITPRQSVFSITVPRGKENLLTDENDYELTSFIGHELTKKWFGHGPFDVREYTKEGKGHLYFADGGPTIGDVKAFWENTRIDLLPETLQAFIKENLLDPPADFDFNQPTFAETRAMIEQYLAQKEAEFEQEQTEREEDEHEEDAEREYAEHEGEKYKPGDFVFANMDARNPESKTPFIVAYWSNDAYYIMGDGSHYVKEQDLTPATEEDFTNYYGEEVAANYKRNFNQEKEEEVESEDVLALKAELEILNSAVEYLDGDDKAAIEEKIASITDALFFLDSTMASGGKMPKGRMYSFLEDDLGKLEKAIKEGDKEEVERFFSYWGQHLESIKTKKNDRLFHFMQDDLGKLEKAIKEGDTEEVERFFSYWGQHLKSLKAKGGSLSDEISKNLSFVSEYSEKIAETLKLHTDLPPWAQARISRTEAVISDIKHALEANHPQVFEKGGAANDSAQFAQFQLDHISKYATSINKHLASVKVLPWMVSKIAISADDLDAVFHYIDADPAKLAKGGRTTRGIARDRMFVSKQEWEQKYDRKTPGKTYHATGGNLKRENIISIKVPDDTVSLGNAYVGEGFNEDLDKFIAENNIKVISSENGKKDNAGGGQYPAALYVLSDNGKYDNGEDFIDAIESTVVVSSPKVKQNKVGESGSQKFLIFNDTDGVFANPFPLTKADAEKWIKNARETFKKIQGFYTTSRMQRISPDDIQYRLIPDNGQEEEEEHEWKGEYKGEPFARGGIATRGGAARYNKKLDEIFDHYRKHQSSIPEGHLLSRFLEISEENLGISKEEAMEKYGKYTVQEWERLLGLGWNKKEKTEKE